jgi:hypothetical protein
MSRPTDWDALPPRLAQSRFRRNRPNQASGWPRTASHRRTSGIVDRRTAAVASYRGSVPIHHHGISKGAVDALCRPAEARPSPAGPLPSPAVRVHSRPLPGESVPLAIAAWAPRPEEPGTARAQTGA